MVHHTCRQLGCVGTIVSPGYSRLNICISSSVFRDVKYKTVFISRHSDVKSGKVFTSESKVYIVTMDWSVYAQQEMAHKEAGVVQFSLQ